MLPRSERAEVEILFKDGACFWVLQQDPGAPAPSRNTELCFNLNRLIGSIPAGAFFFFFYPRVSEKHVLA